MKNQIRHDAIINTLNEAGELSASALSRATAIPLSALRQNLLELMCNGEVVRQRNHSGDVWKTAAGSCALQTHWKTAGLTSVNVEDTMAP